MNKLFPAKVSAVLFTLSILLVGCGGSDSSGPLLTAGSGSGGEPIHGGTVSSPSPVSYSNKNLLTDSFNNYFSLTLERDATVHISVVLENGLRTLEKTRCEGDESKAFIRINGNKIACDHRTIVALAAGTHELHLDYPLDGKGYFSIDKVVEGAVTILPANGNGNKPSAPREFHIGGNNQINIDLLYNYYAYTGSAGDRVVINTFLNEAIPTLMYTRCRGHLGEIGRRNVFGISINGEAYNCEDRIDYRLPADGTFIFHFFFMAPADTSFPVDGYFNVDIQRRF